MFIYFLDESGNSNNWEVDIENQPYMVWSAVGFEINNLREIYNLIDNSLAKTGLENYQHVKARDIYHGSFNRQKVGDEIRNIFRETYLKNSLNNSIIFSSIIKKGQHSEKYRRQGKIPEDPLYLGLRYLVERIAKHHQNKTNVSDFILVIDQDKFNEDAQDNFLNTIRLFGSWGVVNVNMPAQREFCNDISNLIDVYFTNDKTCAGVRIADFVAFQLQRNFRENDGEFNTEDNSVREILNKFARNPDNSNQFVRYGLKIFP